MLKIISQSNSGKSSTILKVYLYIQIYIYIIDCIFRGHKMMIFVGEKFAIFQIIIIGRGTHILIDGRGPVSRARARMCFDFLSVVSSGRVFL